MEPVIYSLQGTLTFQPSLPKGWRGAILSGSDSWYYNGPLGTMVLQRFLDHEFSISYIECDFFQKVKLFWKEEPVLRLQYILNGKLRYSNGDNKNIKLKSGQMNGVWAPDGETMADFSRGSFQMFQIAVRPEIVQELLPQFPNSKSFSQQHLKRWFGKDRNIDIYDTLNMLYAGEARRFFYRTKVREHLLAFLYPIPQHSDKYPQHVKERVYKVDRKILENLSQHHTTEDLARFAKMPEGKLIEAFKEIIGVSMFDRYKEAKLQKAKKYLLETNVQVKVLYEMVGYESYTGFVEAFTKRFDISPFQYRKKYRPFD